MTTSAELVEKVARVLVETYAKYRLPGTPIDVEIVPADMDAARAAISLTLEEAAGVAEGIREDRRVILRDYEGRSDEDWDDGLDVAERIAQALRALNP